MKDVLTIQFDFEKQAISVKCNSEAVKTWEFAKALLGMAGDFVELQIKGGHMRAMQMAMEQQAEDQQIAKLIKGR